MENLLLILLAYLLGSFPSALVIGKIFYNKDIRNFGSGNLGSTNAFRVLGKRGGIIVFILDISKGSLAVLAPVLLEPSLHPLIIALFALVGHVYPIFANFKGGKAVATTAGILLVYTPTIFITLFIIFLTSLKIWKMVSLSSTIISIAGIILVFLGSYDAITRGMFIIFALVIMIKHIPNYKRILNGTENKVSI